MRSTGRNRALRRQVTCLVAAGIASICLVFPHPALARAQRSPSAQETYSVVAGTVFQQEGRTLRGAEVIVKPSPEDGSPSRGKPLSAVSDARGEFAFRVPPMPMRYTVIVRAQGFRAQEKQVSISGEQRADVFFQMERMPAEK
jgi:hypothetical protein